MTDRIRLALGAIFVSVGMGLLVTSIYLMYIYHVLASILSVIIGFIVTSLGIDILKEEKKG